MKIQANHVKAWACLDTIATRKDGSLKVVFETQEVSAATGYSLINLRGQFGCLNFAPEDREIEQPENSIEGAKPNKKSESQKLRAVLYVWWEKMGATGNFKRFYEMQMEKLIEHVKAKL